MDPTIKKAISLILIITVVYVGNKALQSYWGQEAVNNFAFPIYSLEQAKEIAHRDNKLVIADYSAIWCPSCRKLGKEVFSDKTIAKTINKNFVYARLDYDTPEGESFAKKHGLAGFPRVLVLETSGEKIVEMPLTFNPLEYEFNLTKVLDAYSN